MTPLAACQHAARHFAAGRLDQAEAFCAQALAGDKSHPPTLHLLGLIWVDRGRLADGLAQIERAVALRPRNAGYLNSLGDTLRDAGRLAEARTAFETALTLQPDLGPAWFNLGLTLLALDAADGALNAFERAIQCIGRAAEPQMGLGHALRAKGNLAGALAAYKRATRADPKHAGAWMMVSACHAALTQTQPAFDAAQRAIRCAPLRVTPARRAHARRVLVLHSAYDRLFTFAKGGQVRVRRPTNVAQHMDPDHFERIDLYVEHAEAVRSRLRNVDLIFNCVCDGDAAPQALEAAAHWIERLGVPVINSPRAVLATSRDGNARRFASAPGLVFPNTIRLPDATPTRLADAMEKAGLVFPVILRKAGTHMGGTMQLTHSLADPLPDVGSADLFVTQFVEHRPAQGLARKMRVWVVDGQLYPFICTFSESWKIHGADRATLMANREDLRAEERQYLEQPEAYLGAPAYEALCALAAQIPLDVFGIDFTQLKDGRLLIFEANAAMAINPNRALNFPYLAPYAQAILAAINVLLLRKLTT